MLTMNNAITESFIPKLEDKLPIYLFDLIFILSIESNTDDRSIPRNMLYDVT